MSKNSRKHIELQIKEKLNRKHSKVLKDLNERLSNTLKINNSLKAKLDDYKEKLSSLEMDVDRYKDWVNRLQDYLNLSDENRDLLLQELYQNQILNKHKQKMDSRMREFINSSGLYYFSRLFQI